MDDLKASDQGLVLESPAKRRETGQVDANTGQTGYDSQNDSGDEIFGEYETVATVPVTGFQASGLEPTQSLSSVPPQLTQPTQILYRPSPPPDTNPQRPPIVQVAASSPLRGPPTENVPAATKPKPPGGVLAGVMAPAGTTFRLPLGIQKAPPRPAIIDISDDDGPTYKGHSSDEEPLALAKADIKPSVFAKSSKTALGDGSFDHTDELHPRTGNRFREITSSSFYKPIDKDATRNSASGVSMGAPGAHNQNIKLPYPTAVPSLKRSADAMGNFAGDQNRMTKQRTQMGPERAKQVEDVPIGSMDFHLRENVLRMKRILPHTTATMCRDALLARRGNFEDAMELLTSLARPQHPDVQVLSDDEIALDHRPVVARPTAKRELKAPNRSIQDKWSSTQALPRPSQTVQPSPLVPDKPRKRLIQGRKAPSSPPVEGFKPAGSRLKSVQLFDDSDSAIASSPGEQFELEGKVLNFFNGCSAKDLADISNNTEETANIILSYRPFANLENVRQISSETSSSTKTGKKRTTKKRIGDKIVETCLDMWTGYEAVDNLVTQCEALGGPVAEEMKKWGFDVYGAAKSGELEMTSLQNNAGSTEARKGTNRQTSVRDSGIGTPSSSPEALKEDEPGEDIRDGNKSRAGRPKADNFIGQPAVMSPGITLKDYQLVGLNWLALLFQQKLSCILADEMGLGKTCQVIAFLSHLLEKGITGPHLIVVPGSTLENWLREFRRFCPSLVVEPYYGLEAARGEQRMAIEGNIGQINVIVTTYDLASKKVDSKFLRHLLPVVCVYDEGHALKNSQSKRYEALMRIPARFRLLLTGTPLQNNLKELAALLGFILPSLFKERRGDLDFIFKAKATTTTDDSHTTLLSAQRIARAKSMMTPFVLRRKKHQVLKHLPPKTSRTEYCEMTQAQWEVYNTQVQEAREAIQARAAGKKPTKETGNVLMQLRKAAIHPMLFRRLFNDDKIKKMAKSCIKEEDLSDRDPDLVLEDMSYYSDFQLHTFCEEHPTTMAKYNVQNDEWMDSGKVSKLSELVLKYRANGDRVLIFSQFTMVLDILEAVMGTLQVQYFRFDGSTRIDERQDMIDQFYEEKEVTAFLLSTKAGGMGINLACANKVILFDQSFNPQEDIQAENRAHRVGQEREVEVVRLISRGTVEEQIHALGETKLALDDRVAGEGVTDKEDKEVEEKALKLVEEMWEKSEGIEAAASGKVKGN